VLAKAEELVTTAGDDGRPLRRPSSSKIAKYRPPCWGTASEITDVDELSSMKRRPRRLTRTNRPPYRIAVTRGRSVARGRRRAGRHPPGPPARARRHEIHRRRESLSNRHQPGHPGSARRSGRGYARSRRSRPRRPQRETSPPPPERRRQLRHRPPAASPRTRVLYMTSAPAARTRPVDGRGAAVGEEPNERRLDLEAVHDSVVLEEAVGVVLDTGVALVAGPAA
jgi:hypothetical protein